MRCTQCGTELPPAALFCFHCGAQAGAGAPQGVSRRRSAWPVAALAVAALLIVAGSAALLGRRALAPPDRQDVASAPPGPAAGTDLVNSAPPPATPQDLATASAAPQPQKLQDEAAPPPAGGLANGPDVNGPPAEVVAYLKFVRGIEADKQKTIARELENATSMLPSVQGLSADTDDATYKKTVSGAEAANTDVSTEWDHLAARFRKVSPPLPCRAFAAKYYDHLGKVESQVTAVDHALRQADSDPNGALQALTSMQGSASSDADEAIAAADRALDDLCGRYGMRKPFSVRGDAGGSSFIR